MTPALSFTGIVFGMHATAVKPPATAAAVPVATVSLCSCPGSRRCTCMSIEPGAHDEPARNLDDRRAGVDRQIAADARDAVAVDQHVERAVAAVGRIDHAPALQQPFHRLVLLLPAGQQIQHRHAHGDAVGDLLENHRVRAVGDLGRDLDAAVHRPGMHDDHVRLRARHARRRHAERR